MEKICQNCKHWTGRRYNLANAKCLSRHVETHYSITCERFASRDAEEEKAVADLKQFVETGQIGEPAHLITHRDTLAEQVLIALIQRTQGRALLEMPGDFAMQAYRFADVMMEERKRGREKD